ncbi:N-acetyltransferase family protein [Xinfangfangia sp. CPCC 101601]|uniref:N-acetyltransferase family protein n=1 Tax=Pseudogemmobacter lacusdianii TaxID=3069608 RepID=A0ABU0VT87_9RHOB|nr:GNAT family N-acetyltransferase [Xinfangfangia sp. CPCC 101601]MDQ2064940.1 N-acetyltransferase family protein [Xinfangfangia sp. CPCC 101601]
MIRPAAASDAPAIAALMNHWIENTAVTFNPTPKTPTEIEAMIEARAAAGHAFFVATEDSKLLGQAHYGQFRAGLGYATCMEHSISLAPDASGKGLGRLLMQAIEDHARSAGAHQMIAAVSAENPKGRAFHEKLGYRLTATIPEAGFKFGRFIDLHLLLKQL